MKRTFTKALYLPMSMALLLCTTISSQATNIELKTGAIRGAVAAKIEGKTMLYVSEVDGSLSLNTLTGEQVWRNINDTPAITFEIQAHDIDEDGNDDLLAVSGNGTVSAWGSDGELLWRFTPPQISRLCQIATIGEGRDTRIFTGGNDYNLYELDSNGELLSTTPVDGSIFYIESGNFIKRGKETLFLYTLSNDKYASRFFGYIDPDTKKVVRKWEGEDPFTGAPMYMANDLSIADIDKDGRDDVVISGHTGDTGIYPELFAYNGDMDIILNIRGERGDGQRYSHGFNAVLSPKCDEIVMTYGGFIRRYDFEGNLLAEAGERHRGVIYNAILAIPEEDLFFGLGQIGGDNTLYSFDLNDDKWIEQEQHWGGLFSDVEQNLNTLYEQTLNFKLPSYQAKEENEFTVLGLPTDFLDPRVEAMDAGKITFISGIGHFTENTDRSHLVAELGEIALRRDKRWTYPNTREEIVAAARKKEEAGEPFEMWVGHGNDPFFIQIETIEQMIAAAPTTCKGLIYAEMGTFDIRTDYFVNHYMPRIAKAIRDNHAETKLYFRFKNMFWAADVHEPLWQKMFLSGDYKDILIPSAEDTSNRLQDLNFAGRVGMYMSNSIFNFAIRLIDDNPTSWRPFTPGGHRSVSPYLRNAVLASAYGSRYGIFGNIAYLEKPSYNIFFALKCAGVLPQIDPDEILSVGSWGIVKDLDQEYLEWVRARDGHDLLRYKTNDDNAVISKAGVYWCGSNIPEHDYSKIAMGADYRWLNFVPKLPNGMVPIAEERYVETLEKEGVGYFETDINHGYVDGKKVDGKSFGPYMREVVEKGGRSLLMTVEGASWALFKIDEHHARLVVIDPGYVDPAERKCIIKLQNQMPQKATDILSGEELSMSGDRIEITVPAGSMRFVDFEYSVSL